MGYLSNKLVGNNSADFRFKGESVDTTTGLYFMRARYYNPATGSFVSRDPVEGAIEEPQTQHGYSFVSDNPINLSDPSGKDVYNQSDQYITAISEKSGVEIVAPKTPWKGDQDGVIFQDGTIYKNNDGVNINTYGNSLAAPAGLINGARNDAIDVYKAAKNAYTNANYEYSGYYSLNDGTTTGKWGTGGSMSYIQSKNTGTCFSY